MILKISALYVEYDRFYSHLKFEKLTFSPKPNFFHFFSYPKENPAVAF